jgi:hypothetical protein
MASVIDDVLSEVALERRSQARTFNRAQPYVASVRGLRVQRGRATASVQGTHVYVVDLRWGRDGIDGECSCPDSASGNFCKHLVAVGLAVLDAAAAPTTDAGRSAVEQYLATLPAETLRELVVEMAAFTETATRQLETRAALASGSDEHLRKELEQAASSVLGTGRWLDYRQSFGYATRIEGFLDELEHLLDQGAADAVAPSALRVATRVRKRLMHADDSSGVIGQAGQRALELYARACREGTPDQAKLGRWLARFRDESPGWPIVTLDDFADALGVKGLTAYRKAVAAIGKRHADQPVGEFGVRFELDRMLLELADHDGDVDAAIAILGQGQHPQFVAIIDRLQAAGRDDEVITWLTRAVEADRVAVDRLGNGHNSYWLDADRAVELFCAAGQQESAMALARDQLRRAPTPASYDFFLRTAARLERLEIERARVLAWLDADGWSTGQTPIVLALHEGDVERAWAAADRWGAGHAWQLLADAQPQPRPADALGLYGPALDDALLFPGRAEAQKAVAILKRMRQLAAAADNLDRSGRHVESLDDRIAEIRVTLRRRRALIEELDRAGLRGR